MCRFWKCLFGSGKAAPFGPVGDVSAPINEANKIFVELRTKRDEEDAAQKMKHAIEVSKARQIAEADIARFIAEDEAERKAAPDWMPTFDIQKTAHGLTFLFYDDQQIALDYIEHISIAQKKVYKEAGRVQEGPPLRGGEPYISRQYLYGGGVPVARKNLAVIQITMLSGQEYYFKVSRWKLDILLGALIYLWKENTRKGVV